MGYWAGRDYRRYFIEGTAVFDHPGGKQLNLHHETFEPLPEPVPAYVPPHPPPPEPEPKNVLTDYTDENKVDQFIKEGRNVKELKHSRFCHSMGRGGKYTDGCLKCNQLKGK